MAEYRIKYTDTNEPYKKIYINQKNSSGSTNISALQLSVIDQDETAVDLTGLNTSMKLYIGVEGSLQLNGGTLTAVSLSSGTLIYRLTGSDITTVGIYNVQIYCADNATPASATDAITAGDCILEIVDSMTD